MQDPPERLGFEVVRFNKNEIEDLFDILDVFQSISTELSTIQSDRDFLQTVLSI